MPDDIEQVFTRLGLPLFPASVGELSMDCSCPDWEIPCKHVAAVFYLLAEAFDDDPFTILAWRGREREELLGNLQAARSGGPPAADHAEHVGAPLTECLDSYFSLQADLPATHPATSVSAALLDQLPPIDLTVRGHAVPELLRRAYLSLADQPDINQPAEAVRNTRTKPTAAARLREPRRPQS